MAADIRDLIARLNHDAAMHEGVGRKLVEPEIAEAEAQLGIRFPESYRIFLKEFGDGAYWLYGCQTIGVVRPSNQFAPMLRLQDVHPSAPEEISVDGDLAVPLGSLLVLMPEDSNGGAWCWLASQPDRQGEWPLAYYEPFDARMLFYRVASFQDWLNLLIENREEVIRVLDKDERLGLG